MQTFEREFPVEGAGVINPQVLEMVETLQSRGDSVDAAVRELRDYSESLWEDFRNGPEELRGNGNIEALSEAIEKDRNWAIELHWLAHFIEQESDIESGLERFQEVLKIESTHSEPGWGVNLLKETQTDPRIFDVAAIYGALEGRPGLIIRGRKEINRMVKSAQAKRMSGADFLASLEGAYFEADIKSVAERQHRHKKIAKCLMVLGLFVAGDRALDDLSTSKSDTTLTAASTHAIHVKPEALSTSLSTTTTPVAPSPTLPAPAPTTSVPPPSQVSLPLRVEKVSTEPIVKRKAALNPDGFKQRDFGKVLSREVNASLSVLAQEIAQQTGDNYDAETLAEYNGIDDPNNARQGSTLYYKDCPTNGALVRKVRPGITFSSDTGLSEAELDALNGGNFQDIAGYCGRIVIK